MENEDYKKTAGIRLRDDQIEEMKMLQQSGIELNSTTDYLKYKLDMMSPEKMKEMEAKLGESAALMRSAVNKESGLGKIELMRMSKQETELEYTKKELAQKNQQLGELPILIDQRVSQRLQEMEHAQLKVDKEKLGLEIDKKDFEITKLKDEVSTLKDQVKMFDRVEKIAPQIPMILKTLGIAATGMQNGGGLQGAMASLAGLDLGNTSASKEDQEALELGQQLKSLFDETEMAVFYKIVALIAQKKTVLPQILHVTGKLVTGDVQQIN